MAWCRVSFCLSIRCVEWHCLMLYQSICRPAIETTMIDMPPYVDAFGVVHGFCYKNLSLPVKDKQCLSTIIQFMQCVLYPRRCMLNMRGVWYVRIYIDTVSVMICTGYCMISKTRLHTMYCTEWALHNLHLTLFTGHSATDTVHCTVRCGRTPQTYTVHCTINPVHHTLLWAAQL